MHQNKHELNVTLEMRNKQFHYDLIFEQNYVFEQNYIFETKQNLLHQNEFSHLCLGSNYVFTSFGLVKNNQFLFLFCLSKQMYEKTPYLLSTNISKHTLREKFKFPLVSFLLFFLSLTKLKKIGKI
jgi:hypothetical protein